MYFIRSGKCVVLLPLVEGSDPTGEVFHGSFGEQFVAVKELGRGDYFGEVRPLPCACYVGSYVGAVTLTGAFCCVCAAWLAAQVSLVFRVERTATICATVVCDMSALSAADFEEILDRFPAFADEIERGFSQYLRAVRCVCVLVLVARDAGGRGRLLALSERS
mgnify:CR=1 FL=1